MGPKDKLKEIENKRDRQIDNAGTGPLNFLNTGDIAVDANAGGLVYDFRENSKTTRYYPFDTITINNNSTSGLNIYVNQRQDWQKVARAGTITKISDFPGVTSVRLSKRDGSVTIAAGEIETTVERAPLTIDEQTRREAKPSLLKSIMRLVGV